MRRIAEGIRRRGRQVEREIHVRRDLERAVRRIDPVRRDRLRRADLPLNAQRPLPAVRRPQIRIEQVARAAPQLSAVEQVERLLIGRARDR